MSNQISADSSTSSMWGGRFSEATDSFVAEFTASVGFDQRFACLLYTSDAADDCSIV